MINVRPYTKAEFKEATDGWYLILQWNHFHFIFGHILKNIHIK